MSSRIVEMLKTISSGGTISEIPQSRLEAIAVAISKNASYDNVAQSRIEELLLDLYNNGAGSGTDALPYSEVEAILIAAINGDTYTGTVSSELSQAFVDSVDAIGGETPGPGPGPEPPEPIPEMTYDCQRLMSMVLKNYNDLSTKISISNYAFAYDTTIETAYFPKVTKVPTSCFEEATNIKIISFEKATSTSGNKCFYNCANLEELYLPLCTTAVASTLAGNMVKKLRIFDTKASSFNFDFASSGAVCLEILILRSTTKVNGTPSFYSSSPIAKLTGKIYVLDSLVNTYKTDSNWSAYADIIDSITNWEG